MKEKTRVLIADDNQDFSRTLSSYINNQKDMEVIAMAKDGDEAVEMISNNNPDVVLLDVIMPHLDGLGVLEKVNEMEPTKKPVCIMLSAVGQDKITQKAISLGAEYYIVKPFDIELLIKRIKEIKFHQPNQTQNYFITREIKPQYIELSLDESKKEENDTSNKAQEKNENNNEANEVKAEKVTENETTTEPESENDKIAEEKATEQVEASPTKEQAEKTTKSKTAKSTTKASATKKTSSAKKTATKKKSTTSKASMITKISGKKTAKTKK